LFFIKERKKKKKKKQTNELKFSNLTENNHT